MLTKQLREMERQSEVVNIKNKGMNKDLVLEELKALENVIKSIEHTLGSDELEDIQFHIETIKLEIKTKENKNKNNGKKQKQKEEQLQNK